MLSQEAKTSEYTRGLYNGFTMALTLLTQQNYDPINVVNDDKTISTREALEIAAELLRETREENKRLIGALDKIANPIEVTYPSDLINTAKEALEKNKNERVN